MNEIRNDEEQSSQARVGRVDFSVLPKIDALDRTPTGGVRINARIARSGVLVYRRADGSTVREYRPDSEAFAPETLKSADDAVVTVGHPAGGMVTPGNARSLSVGHVRGPARRDGTFMDASLAVLDASAIDAIGRGELVELSAGYTLRIDETPGRTPSGEPYDRVQRDIRLNHTALLPEGAGRAGRDVSLRFDGLEVHLDADREDDMRTPHAPASARQTEMRADTMKTERIDGVDYEIGSTAHAQARARYDEAQKTRIAELEQKTKDLEAKATSEKARADSLEQKLKGLEDRLTPAAVDRLVADRTALIAKAAPILGTETKLDGKSEHEIRLAVVAKLDPSFKIDSIEEAQRELYVRARFDADTRAGKTHTESPLARAKREVFAPGGAPGGMPPFRADDADAEPYVPLMQRQAAGMYSGGSR